MPPVKLPGWLQKIVAAMGGGGLFVVAFLDSSVLSFPFVTDALVFQLAYSNPARMPYYIAMAAIGSLAGCIWLYLLAEKGARPTSITMRVDGPSKLKIGWIVTLSSAFQFRRSCRRRFRSRFSCWRKAYFRYRCELLFSRFFSAGRFATLSKVFSLCATVIPPYVS